MFSLHNRIALKADDILHIVALEKDLHPGFAWVDLYKLLNQAWYGPTHINQNKKQIVANITTEFESMPPRLVPFIQDIGNNRGFLRLDLSFLHYLMWLKRQMSAVEKADNLRGFASGLADIVLQSCLPKQPDHAKWLKDFQAAVSLLGSEGLIDFPTSGPEHQRVMESGEMPSHSAYYKEHYDPHYRVVHYKAIYNYIKINKLYEEEFWL